MEIFCPYFPAFGLNTERYEVSPNTGKYGPEKTPYLDTFHRVLDVSDSPETLLFMFPWPATIP